MGKVTVLVKGDIYCKECGCIKRGGSATARVDPNNYPNPSLIIEGDLNIVNFALLDDRIRLVATGLIHMRGLGTTSWGQSFDGTKELYTVKYISAKGE